MLAWKYRTRKVKLQTVITALLATVLFVGGVVCLFVYNSDNIDSHFIIASIPIFLGLYLWLFQMNSCPYCGSWSTRERYFESLPRHTRTCNKCQNEWAVF